MSETYNRMPKAKTVKLVVSIVVAAILACIVLFSSVYTINEQEQGVIVTLGKPTKTVYPGLNVKLPFIQQVYKIDTTIKGLAVGYNEDNNESVNAESLMITSDFNFVNVDFYVEYKVSEPITYLYASSNPVGILKNIVQSCIRTVVGTYDVDSVLTDGKSEIQAKVKEMVIEKLDEQQLGLVIVNLTIQDAEPPTEEVMQAFKAVETAKQEKETIINNANKYRNEKMPEAEADVDNILQEANTTKTQRINDAEAQVALFNAMYEEYKKNPDMTKKRMFYEAMESILPELEVIIDSGDGNVQKILPLDSFVDGTDTSSSTSSNSKSDSSSKSETNNSTESGGN